MGGRYERVCKVVEDRKLIFLFKEKLVSVQAFVVLLVNGANSIESSKWAFINDVT